MSSVAANEVLLPKKPESVDCFAFFVDGCLDDDAYVGGRLDMFLKEDVMSCREIRSAATMTLLLLVDQKFICSAREGFTIGLTTLYTSWECVECVRSCKSFIMVFSD